MLKTTADIAAELKVSSRRVLALAEARGVKPAMDLGNVKLWPAGTAAKLTPGKPGRPPLNPGPVKRRARRST